VQLGCVAVIAQMQASLTANGTGTVMDVANQISAAVSSAQSSASAITGTAYVEVTGFKGWIQRSITAVGDAIHAAIVVQCQIPSWVAALDAVNSALQSFVALVQGVVAIGSDVVSAAVAAGTAVVQTVDAGIGITGFLFNHIWLLIPLAIVGVGGWFAWKHRAWLRAKLEREHFIAHGRALPGTAGLGRRRRRRGRGLRDFGPAAKYEVDGQRFDSKKRAEAMARQLTREYGHPVHVRRAA